VRVLTPLLIEAGRSPRPQADLVRRHAEGLAGEIYGDVMAPTSEITAAILLAIDRFAARPSRRHEHEAETIAQDIRNGRLPDSDTARVADRIEAAIRRYAGPWREAV